MCEYICKVKWGLLLTCSTNVNYHVVFEIGALSRGVELIAGALKRNVFHVLRDNFSVRRDRGRDISDLHLSNLVSELYGWGCFSLVLFYFFCRFWKVDLY